MFLILYGGMAWRLLSRGRVCHAAMENKSGGRSHGRLQAYGFCFANADDFLSRPKTRAAIDIEAFVGPRDL